jgi:hypothetical protein
MDNVEKLEYKLQLILIYKGKFYADNLMHRVTAKISKTIANVVDKKAMAWAEAQALKDIEGNGYPDINPFLESYEQTFTLFYTPGLGLSEVPKTKKSIEAHDANEFYKAVKEQDPSPWMCDTIDEAMFDILNEKYGIDHTGGFQDQLREAVEQKKNAIVGYPRS